MTENMLTLAGSSGLAATPRHLNATTLLNLESEQQRKAI